MINNWIIKEYLNLQQHHTQDLGDSIVWIYPYFVELIFQLVLTIISKYFSKKYRQIMHDGFEILDFRYCDFITERQNSDVVYKPKLRVFVFHFFFVIFSINLIVGIWYLWIAIFILFCYIYTTKAVDSCSSV